MHHNSTIFLQPLNFAKMSDDILYHEKFRWFFSHPKLGKARPHLLPLPNTQLETALAIAKWKIQGTGKLQKNTCNPKVPGPEKKRCQSHNLEKMTGMVFGEGYHAKPKRFGEYIPLCFWMYAENKYTHIYIYIVHYLMLFLDCTLMMQIPPA